MAQERVIITAGGAGLGLVIAKAFLARGARVAVCDVNQAALDQAHAENPGLTGWLCDVSDEAAAAAFIGEAIEHLGGLDVLINNAGIKGPTGPVEELEGSDWRACIDVNLNAGFYCTKAAAPALKAQGSGSIVNISSTAGLFGYPLRSPYAAAKWAVIGFTKSISIELGPFGIRVNAICPGALEGARMDRVIADEARSRGVSKEAVRAHYTEGVSLKTFIDPEDIAEAILFLTSPAGARISGQAIPVDGDTFRPN